MKFSKQTLAVLSVGMALVITLLITAGCGSSPSSRSGASSGPDELDTAIRDASDYLNDNIPAGSKIVILNIQSSSPDLSDYIIDELLANAVTDKVFSVVDRQQLDAIRSEQNFQWSGEVDDNSAMEIGKFFGAQTIVSGAINRLGTGYRIRIRALEVQTAQVQGQYNRNIASSPMIAAIMESGGADSSVGSTGTRTAAASSGSTASGTAASNSGLTITGLSSYNNRYVIATAVDRGSTDLFGFSDLTNRSFKAGRINNGSVTLKLWTSLRQRNIYDGNEQNVTFTVSIVDKEEFSLDPVEMFPSIEPGIVVVNFNNGRGSGNFVFTPVQPAASAQPPAPAQPAASVQPPAPAQPQTAQLRNGTYTFYPRLRVNQAGVDKNLYLDRILVKGQFFTIFFTGGPTGRAGDGDYGPFWGDYITIQLQNLGSPGRPLNPINKGEDDDPGRTGGFYLTFQGVTGRRFSLTSTRQNPPWTFDEIILREPDVETGNSSSGSSRVQAAQLKDGTHTFYPRLRVNQAGVDKNLYLDRIVVRGQFFTMFFTGGPTGRAGDGDYGPFWGDYSTIQLQNLSSSGRPLNPINKGEDDDPGRTGGFYLTFQGVTGTRFSLTSTRQNPPWTFDEIILGEPD